MLVACWACWAMKLNCTSTIHGIGIMIETLGVKKDFGVRMSGGHFELRVSSSNIADEEFKKRLTILRQAFIMLKD